MEWIEITRKTVGAAVEAALDELGVDEADLEYEVLEEPKRGLLSRLSGATSARIRARVKPISREKPDRRRRRSGRDEAGPARGRSPGASAPSGARSRKEPATAPPRQSRPGPAQPVPAADETRRPQAGGEPDQPQPGDEGRDRGGAAAGGPGGGGAGTRKRSRPPKKRNSAGPAGERGRADAAESKTEEGSVSGTVVPLDEQVELAENFTRGLVERFGFPAEVVGRADGDDDVLVDVTGADLGLLIGPKASTLDAVQEVVRIMVHHRIGGHGARIHVDVAGYRARRQAALADFARQAASRAIESGRDQVFEPMSPADRKVVHDTVSAIDGVETISEGEEPRRRVVIKAS